MIKRIVVYLSICLLVSGCCNDNEVFGVYYSYRHEKGVEHYVELFPDSTYNHVYIQNGEKVENKGVWTVYKKESSRILVDFYDWENFGYAKDYCTIYGRDDINGYNVIIKNKRLILDIDDYDKNFKKE